MITCPVCHVGAEPATVQGPIAICAACGFTLHIDEAGTITKATMKHFETLTDAQVAGLRAARQGVPR